MSLFVKLHQHLQEKYLETTNTRLPKDHKPAQDLVTVSTTRMSTSPVHNQQTGVTTAMERVTGPIIAQRDGGSNQPRPVALQEQSDETVKYNLSPFISHDQDFEFECSSASSFRVDNLRRNLDF